VKTAFESREVITVLDGSICLQGAYHKPAAQQSDSWPHGGYKPHTAILFVNSGNLPRAATGNSAVYWADAFAQIGYPSFRFDLPGLGDSDGDLPRDTLGFLRLVNAGHYASTVSRIATTLTERFNFSGVVVVGHCAGAVSALYATAACKEIKGIVLLDPYFHLQQEITNVREKIHFWALGSRIGEKIRKAYRPFKQLVRGKGLPRNANRSLIRCWNQAGARLPMLVLTSAESKPKPGNFDYIAYLHPKSQQGCRVVVQHINGTSHSFAERIGKETVRGQIEKWLGDCFPLMEHGKGQSLQRRFTTTASNGRS